MADQDANSVQGRYHLYKRGTERIAGWLVRTASQFVDVPTICGLRPTNTGAPRRDRNGRIDLTTRDLVTIAKAIVSEHESDSTPTTATISVPTPILDLLQQVIDGRKFCAAFYSEDELSSLKDNESHQYFIHILEQIQTLLQTIPRRQDDTGLADQPSDKQKLNDTSASTLESTLENIFACLKVHEPSENPLGVQGASSSTPYHDSQIGLQNEKEDAAFALYCHLEDLRQQRSAVAQTWVDYAAGKISLLAACMTTEAACGLMRVCDHAFVSERGDSGDWPIISSILSTKMISREGVVYLYPLNQSHDNRTTQQGQDLIELLCPTAATLLQDVAAKVKRFTLANAANMAKGSTAKVASLILNGECFFFADILHSQVGLLAMISDFVRRTSAETQGHKSSEFLVGLTSFFNTGHLPIWLVVAAEMFIEIYEIIGLRPECASEAMIDSFSTLRPKLEAFRDFWAKRGGMTEEYTSYIDNMFRSKPLLESEVRAGNEIVHELDAQGAPTGRTINMNGKPVAGVIGLPSTSGCIMYKQKSRFHDIAVATGNCDGMILAMAHLYTCSKRLGLTTNVWHDMELVLASHQSKQALVAKTKAGAGPRSLLNQFLLALGVSATNFAKGKPIPDCPTDDFIKKNGRRVQNTSELMQAFATRMASDRQLGCQRGEVIEIVLKELTTKASSANSKKGKTSRPDDAADCTAIQLLSTFKKHFMADEPHLNYDYVGFWLRCEGILGAINNILGSPGRKPCQTVYACLKDAAESPRLSDTALANAAKVLNAAIEQNGNQFSQEAFNQSSGRIPKAMRPNLTRYDCSKIAEAFQTLASDNEVLSKLSVNLSAAGAVVYDREGSEEKFEEVMKVAGGVLGKERRAVAFSQADATLPDGSKEHGLKVVEDLY